MIKKYAEQEHHLKTAAKMCRPIFVVLQKNIGKIGESPIVLQDFVQDMHDQCMSTFISAN